jgi:predicted DsbA family dithiol-disulfide isomerase
MKVEIWSDVVCPWCYIGKKRFEDAVQSLADEGTELDLEVTFRPFQLDPSAPVGGASPVAEAYAKKFGGPEKAEKILAHVTRVAAETGITFNMDKAVRANTLRAHRMMHLALVHHGPVAQRAMKQHLLEAYFTNGENVADDDVLLAAAAAAGIPRDTAVTWLDSDEGDAEVRRDIVEAGDLGITAVPTFVIDGKWAIPGAQDVDVFVRALRRMHDKSLAGE